MKSTTAKADWMGIHIGSKLIKEDGKIVTVVKYGMAGKEVVYGLSDETMAFRSDIGMNIKLLKDTP